MKFTSSALLVVCLLTTGKQSTTTTTEAFLVPYSPNNDNNENNVNSGHRTIRTTRHQDKEQGPRRRGQMRLHMIASTSSSSSSTNNIKNNNDSSNSYSNNNNKEEEQHHFLLKTFVTSSGEIINPYNVLQVSRDADRAAIKGSYKQLAKRYHPDGARNRAILPGKCNNEDEVREEWERIQIAYTILIDNKMRKRYDRSEMIADPGAAVRRAAVDATWTGVSTIGKGLLSLGKKAVESITTTTTTTPTTTTATTTTSSSSNSADDATIDNTDNHNSNKQATM